MQAVPIQRWRRSCTSLQMPTRSSFPPQRYGGNPNQYASMAHTTSHHLLILHTSRSSSIALPPNTFFCYSTHSDVGVLVGQVGKRLLVAQRQIAKDVPKSVEASDVTVCKTRLEFKTYRRISLYWAKKNREACADHGIPMISCSHLPRSYRVVGEQL